MTVMLYNDPHPVHRRMAEAIGAELVPANRGGIFDRVRSAMSRRFDEPLILEGGVPLFEGALLRLFRRVREPVILLAADETQHNVHRPLPYYSTGERLTHRLAHRFVDAVIAVSETVADDAASLVDGPVTVAHPFVLDDRADALDELTPSLEAERVLCVGEYRPANNQDALVEAANLASTDVRVDLVGKGTENATAGERVRRHGFVEEERLLELFEQASLFCLPAQAGAYPVSTLEGLQAGLPLLTTKQVGTATLAKQLHRRFVTTTDPRSIADALDWYFDAEVRQRQTWSVRARSLGEDHTEAVGLPRFEDVYGEVMTACNGAGTKS